MPRNKYPLTKICVECDDPFTARNGAEFRNDTCGRLCGNRRAVKKRSGADHWNHGNPRAVRGASHPFFGKHHTIEANETNRLKHMGNKAWNKGLACDEQTREKLRCAKIGKRVSPRTEFQKGIIPWNKGKRLPHLSGANNSNWKGGVTPALKKLRNGSQFKEWRLAVFTRDDWTCQRCFERGVSLHPHHILNFSEHAALRFDLTNGVTLCVNCHARFHALYGRKCNTHEQLIDFLGTLFLRKVA